MGHNRKLTCLIVFIFTIIFAGCNIYKMLSTSEEDVKQFLCHHVKRDKHKDMLHRQQHHHKDKVKSHTIEKETISFEEKLKRDGDETSKENEYQKEILGEDKCRGSITREQLEGMKLLNKMGLVTSICSLVSALIGLGAMKERADGTNRFLLVPYIVLHPMLIGVEFYAGVLTYQLVHKVSSFHIIMMVLSILLILIFTALVVLYYKALSALPAGEEGSVSKGKEAFDYATMVEEKDASFA